MEEETSAPKPVRQKSFSRRVSFNEATILPPREHRRDYNTRDLESRIAANRRPRFRICGRICNSGCFWISTVLAVIVFLLLLCGGLYYAFLKSHMPHVRLQRLDVVSDAAGTANVTVLLNALNGGDRTVVIYRRMIASVVASGVKFGVVRLADVRQPPRNSTALAVAAGTVLEEQAARDLRSRNEAHVLVINVKLKGRIDLIVRGRKMHGFPFKIECRSINQSEIVAGRASPCSTQLLPLG